MANRVASIAATQAHDQLGIDPRTAPVEVAPAIHRADIVLMYRPLPGLFGAYLADTPAKGILVNNRLSRAVRRHTAAHELGHHQLDHGTIRDVGASSDEAQPFAVGRGAPDVEKVAEAFASWFLMPLRGVRAVLAQMGLEKPVTAAHVYQLSLRLGTSYATTVRHLVSLRLADSVGARTWGSVPPANLKRQLARECIDSTRGIDVWDLADVLGCPGAVASPYDLLVLPAQRDVPDIDGPAEVVQQLDTGQWVLRCTGVDQITRLAVGTPSHIRSLSIEPQPRGLYLGECSPPPVETELGDTHE